MFHHLRLLIAFFITLSLEWFGPAVIYGPPGARRKNPLASRVSGTKFIMNKFVGGTKDGTVQAQERFKLVKHCSANDSTEREQQEQ